MSEKSCFAEMTPCPECLRHIRHSTNDTDVKCPFCDHHFSPGSDADSTSTGGTLPSGLKKGVMAVSFVGVGLVGGLACSETAEQPVYGVPMPEDAGYYGEEDVDGDTADSGEVGDTADSGEDDDASGGEDVSDDDGE